MCSDLTLDPLTALTLYCTRVRVETLFAMLKGVIGAFRYHFWSKRLPRHSRRPKKNALLKPPAVHDLPTVQRTWQACEGFVLLGCIALGLLQLVALKFSHHIWDAFPLFLRTRSRALPSEQTVKTVLAHALQQDFLQFAPSATLPLIPPQPARSEPGEDRAP